MSQPHTYRILLIDDNRAIHEDFRKILDPPQADDDLAQATASLFDTPVLDTLGPVFQIDSAYQGQEGVAKVKASLLSGSPYALVFVDIRMPPGWDGIETISRLWQEAGDLQVVICTAYSDYSWGDIMKRLGHSDQFLILKKPFDTVEVRQLAYSLTRKWSLSRQVSGQLLELQTQVAYRTANLEETNRQLGLEVEQHRLARTALEHMSRRTEMLLSSAGQGIFGQSLTGTFSFVNPAAARMLGYAPQDLLDRDVHALTHHRRADGTAYPVGDCPVARTAKDGLVSNLDTEVFWRADGTSFPVEYVSTPVMEGDAIVGVVVLFNDVTEKRNASKALELSLSLLKATLESTADGILVVDADGRMTSFNDRFVQIWQLPSHVLGSQDDNLALACVVRQLRYPDTFMTQVRELYNNPEAESFDILEFLDGRTLERYSRPQRLDGRAVGRVWSFRDITERTRAEQARRDSEAKFQAILEAAPDAIVITDADGTMLLVNARTEQQFGYDRTELLGKPVELLMPQRFQGQHPMLRRDYMLAPTLRPMGARAELLGRRRDGTEFSVEVCLNPLLTKAGTLVVGSIRDVTERLALETQLRESQKLEAVGQLAAGVAHDFNNLLTVILCHASDLAADLAANAGLALPVKEIQQAAEGAANLTRQLLMFSRKQPIQPVVLNLGRVIDGVGNMLTRLLREDITLQIDIGPEELMVVADPGMLEQVLVNLVINARDAMPEGGRLSIQIGRAAVPGAAAAQWPASGDGYCVFFSVADTGTGMNETVKARMFEPFFTTKEPGHGTGLGLSTTHGIVRQHGGWIAIESEPGRGSTFTIYLPLAPSDSLDPTLPDVPQAVPRGHETILLVEDEPSLRRMARIMLERLGYHILVAESGRRALPVWEEHRNRIDLLLTDLVMPDGMDGMKLARVLRAEKPELPVIYCSGYSEDVVQGSATLQEGTNFLRKPYHPSALATIIRNTLNRQVPD